MIRSKKVLLFMCMMMSLVLISGCNLTETTNKMKMDKEFFIDYYNISFTASQEWSETDQDNFDLQITNGDSYFSVMTYYTIDLPEGDTPESIYAWQNEDLFSKRENVEIVAEEPVVISDGKIITATMFSAERDGKKNYYYSCLVQFGIINKDVFSWIIVTAQPSYMQKNKDVFLDIMKTMEYVEDKVTEPENVL